MSVQIQPVHTQTFDYCVNPLKSVTFYNSSHTLKLHQYSRLRALPIKHKYEIQHDAFSHIGSSAVGDWIWKCEISVFPQMTLQCPHHTLQILSISGIFRSYWANYKKWPTKWRRNKFKRAISAFSFEIPAAFQSVQFSRITLCRFWRFQEGWCSAEKQLAGRSENKNLASFPKNSHETYFFFVQIESYFVQYLTSAVYISGSFEDSKSHNIMSLSRVKIEVFFEENCERCFPKTNKVGHVWHSPRPCWISQ